MDLGKIQETIYQLKSGLCIFVDVPSLIKYTNLLCSTFENRSTKEFHDKQKMYFFQIATIEKNNR